MIVRQTRVGCKGEGRLDRLIGAAFLFCPARGSADLLPKVRGFSPARYRNNKIHEAADLQTKSALPRTRYWRSARCLIPNNILRSMIKLAGSKRQRLARVMLNLGFQSRRKRSINRVLWASTGSR